ncbi:hypothetical protein [Spirosoma foliorum]|uniref:DUF4157 domain-containing protein n=1 Tax=Spirosoma foliorum TaxID=2710596 RepID=A0A7G5GMP6_9BACT|nr:hypothetical protein [Spirosoma foliorum]QMW00138.1 hypothetical protein H3H32_19095 [Spirosoma foliorum]
MFVIHLPSLGPDGMALFPFILVKRPNPGPALLNHERIHLRQQAELGILPFYIWYGLEYLVRRFHYRDHYSAYRNISFEREAFSNDQDLSYLKTRSFWGFWRYIANSNGEY